MSGEVARRLLLSNACFLSVYVPTQIWLWKRRAQIAELVRQMATDLAWDFPGYHPDPNPFPHFHLFRRSPRP